MTVKVPHPLRVVAVSGGMQRPSKSVALAEHLLALIAEQLPCERHLVEIGALAPQFAGAPWRSHLPGSVEQALALVEQADVLVVATPVYRGSFTGLFKHFFDFIDQDALVDTPVLLAATGGSDRHALMIDHQLRPLFSFSRHAPCRWASTRPTGTSWTTACTARRWPSGPVWQCSGHCR